jgi:hypothetical protein
MTSRTGGLIVAVLHVAIVCSLGAKFYVDRATRPRVWVRTVGYDPEAVIRGRYVRLGLAVEARAPKPYSAVSLDVAGGRLVATPDPHGRARLRQPAGPEGQWSVGPVAFFLAEHVPDPTLRQRGEELWAEVTVPRSGLPRPIRLAVKRNGRLEPVSH